MRLNAVYYDKLKRFFIQWKLQTFDHFRELVEAKKARAIDRLIRENMGDLHFFFLLWKKETWRYREWWKMHNTETAVTAEGLLKRLIDRRLRYGWLKLSYDRKAMTRNAIKRMQTNILKFLLLALYKWRFGVQLDTANKAMVR